MPGLLSSMEVLKGALFLASLLVLGDVQGFSAPLALRLIPWLSFCASSLAFRVQVLGFCLFVQQYVMLCRSLCSTTEFLKLLLISMCGFWCIFFFF